MQSMKLSKVGNPNSKCLKGNYCRISFLPPSPPTPAGAGGVVLKSFLIILNMPF